METSKKETRKVLMKLGCAGSLFYTLNREFGHPSPMEEKASILLCGGLMQTGHQCGMLWGSTLAAGAESLRRNKNKNAATSRAIILSRHLLKSYANRAGTHNCREVTKCDFTKPLGLAKYMLLGKTFVCTRLSGNWAPEALQSLHEGLEDHKDDIPRKCQSCASEVARKMGFGEKEAILVAGFAGGIGLSGNACGALAASIFLRILTWFRMNPDKNPPYFNNPEAKKLLAAFYRTTDSSILCHEISGKRFNTLEEHTEYLNSGGCATLINVLAQA
jgi:hypothetical protein